MNRLTTSLCAVAIASLSTQAIAQTVLTPTADAYIQQGTPTTNYGTGTTLLVRKDSANTLTRAAYFQFDLSSVPTGTITSAVLRVYGSHDTGGTGVAIKAIGGTATGTWSETSITYNTSLTLTGADFTGTPLATTTVAPPPAAYYTWDVTSFITSRRTLGHATIGLGFTGPNTYRATFSSREATTNKPQLVVTVGTVEPPPPPPPPPPLTWEPSCPSGYNPVPGLNRNFPTPTGNRAFSLNLPASTATARPVWVPLTGTVESTYQNLDGRGGNRALTNDGYIVIGPVRACANQDPNVTGGACNGVGTDGWHWRPWNEGRASGTAGNKWMNVEGPDSLFLEAVVKCVATKYPVDQTRVFIGGISSGGTMANRALLFNSDFWAGGLPISGEWYVTSANGAALSVDGGRTALRNAPTAIHQGRVGPYPLRTNTSEIPMYPMIVMTLWGGPTDTYGCSGSTCLADYRPPTQAASNYFSSLDNVVHLACTSSHGHQWPTINRAAFNSWALRTLSSHPKGSAKSAFGNKLVTNPPPSGYSCVVGRYTDHY